MKKTLAILLSCTMILGLAACGDKTRQWNDKDFVFTTGENKGNQIVVDTNSSIYIDEGGTYVTEYEGDGYEEYTEQYVSNRGVKLGMTRAEFEKLHKLIYGYAVWELYSYSDEGGYNTQFASFKGQKTEEMLESDDEIYGAWLDIGFCKENGKWRLMADSEVQNTWFCDADYNDYEEVVVYAVNFEDDVITGISLEHFKYNEDWATWQDWDD